MMWEAAMNELTMNDLVIMADDYFREIVTDYQNAIAHGQYRMAAYLEEEAANTMTELMKYGIITNGETDD